MDYPGMSVRRHQPHQHAPPHQHNHNHEPELSPSHHHRRSESTSAMVIYPNKCSNSAPFLHFPGPPEYPPIEHHTVAYRKPPPQNSRYPDDLDTIEVFVEEHDDCRYSYRGRKSGRNSKREAQVKWSRNNIAATMEKFEPLNSPTSDKCQTLPLHHPNFYHDYSYAYYEPGAAMRHLNIPPRDDQHPPPPNSIRALLSKRNPNASLSSSSSTPAKSSSMHENPYEEIMGSSKGWKGIDNSLDSLNQNVFKEELKHVQSSHRRVLGELDLSVEAMLMPTLSDNSNDIPDHDEPVDNLADMMSSVVSTEELLSPSGNLAAGGGDIDSGFSGSSSGASYVGSLRYHRRGSGGGACSSMYGSSSRSSQRSQDDSGIASFPNRSGSLYNGNSKSSSHYDNISPSSVDAKLGGKSSFWKKGWKKFPSLTSSSTASSSSTNGGTRTATMTNVFQTCL